MWVKVMIPTYQWVQVGGNTFEEATQMVIAQGIDAERVVEFSETDPAIVCRNCEDNLRCPQAWDDYNVNCVPKIDCLRAKVGSD